MRCPHCDNKVLQKSGSSTRLRTHGPIEFGDDGIVKAKCYWCKQLVEVPIELTKAVLENERFVIRKAEPESTA